MKKLNLNQNYAFFNKAQKITSFLLIFVAVIFIANSCTKEIEVSNLNNNENIGLRNQYSNMDSLNIVTLEEIDHIAHSAVNSLFSDTNHGTKTVERIEELKDEENELKTLIYVIIYQEGGFLLVSGDKRFTPILAYGDKEEWGSEDMGGLDVWIHCTKEDIKDNMIRFDLPPDYLRVQWEKYLGDDPANPKIIPDDPNDPNNPPCPTNYQVWETGRYVDQVAQWRQGGIFSFYSPSDDGCDCDRKPAGCGPVAMAMVMRYYQHPTGTFCYGPMGTNNCVNLNSLEYSSMPRSVPNSNCNAPVGGEMSASLLTRICGSASWTSYGVLGNCSTATYWGTIPSAFESMGYDSGGDWGRFDTKKNEALNDLKNFRPVLFTGTLNLVNLSDWHTWVGDGYKFESYNYMGADPNGNGEVVNGPCHTIKNIYIGMNWGQGGRSNAWYLINDSFQYNGVSEPSTYDTYIKILTNIRP